MLIGLLIGILIAAGIAAYINFGPKPFVMTKPDASAGKPVQSAPASGGNTPIALPGKPGDRPVTTTPAPAASQSAAAATEGEKTKFDFYKILPGGETASAPLPARSPEAAAEKVALQAGAYQDPSEADNLKARLAMMGVEAKVQRVDLGEKGVFYRVRLGPFDTPADADEMRTKLASEGIETSVVKSNPKPATAAAAKH